MAPSSPSRPIRHKRAAISSPPNPLVKYNRNQSEIALKWWSRKNEAVVNLEDNLEEAEAKVASLEEALSVANDRIVELEAQLEDLMSNRNRNVTAVMNAVEEHGGFTKITDKVTQLLAIGAMLVSFLGVIMKRSHNVTRLRAVCDALFKNVIFGAEATGIVLEEIYQKYIFSEKKRVFLPWKILRAIDLCMAGSLNYSGVEALRSVEGLGRYERGILPSRSQIQRVAYQLHEVGQHHIPFSKQDSEVGESFAYDYEKFIRFLLKTFKLYEIAQVESVELCMTLDGAELCKGLSHITAGVKITDYRAIDPKDGTPLSSEGVFGRIFRTQSRNYCFAMKALLGKDCKTAYKEFTDFFQFFERLKKYGLPESALGPRIKPMEIWSPQDLSSIWKSLNTGGGAKKNGNNHFCHVCPCTGNTIARFLVEENR